MIKLKEEKKIKKKKNKEGEIEERNNLWQRQFPRKKESKKHEQEMTISRSYCETHTQNTLRY